MTADEIYARNPYQPDPNDENEMLVYAFFEKFFRGHDMSAIDAYMHPDYIQHDWDVPAGRDGFRGHFAKIFEIFPQFHVNPLHIITKGDMLVLHGYGVTDPGKIEVLVCDVYRVKDGLLYEHWGTVQNLPPEQFGSPTLMFEGKQP